MAVSCRSDVETTYTAEQRGPSVSLLELLAATASLPFFTEANAWKTLPKAPSLIHVPNVLWLPSLNQFFGSFFPAL